MIQDILGQKDVSPKIAVKKDIKARLLQGFQINREQDFLESKKTLFANSDLLLGLAAPKNL
jgi:homogentisate 1,2-dioxygenase